MNRWIAFFLIALVPAVGYADHMDVRGHADLNMRIVHTEELLEWYARGVDMTVLDARGAQYLDGYCLPGAKWASLRYSDDKLRTLIPAEDSLVVVYCSNIDCPASGWMYERLVRLGYRNLYEYPEGIDEWMDLGYPTDTMECSLD